MVGRINRFFTRISQPMLGFEIAPPIMRGWTR
jgi:hypothetical protein